MTRQILATALVALAWAPGFAHAKPVVKNLGGGLEQIASPAGRAKSLAGQPELKYPVVFDASAGRSFESRSTASCPPRRSSGSCAPCRASMSALPISVIAQA